MARRDGISDVIANAREALTRGDLESVLDSLIAAYGTLPAPELGELITVVSAKFPVGAPIKSKRGRDKFSRTEAAKRASDVPMQIAGHDYLDDGIVILATGRPPDPRITSEILATLRRLPRRSAVAMPFYDGLFAGLERTRDPAIAVVLRDDVRPGLVALKVKSLRDHVEKKLDRTATKLAAAATPKLAAADARAITTLRTELGTSDRSDEATALYAAVYANPRDPAPRLVLLDALATTRDPRGELLALQLASRALDAKARRRVDAILKQHRAQLIGTMESWLMVHGLEFAGGFVAKGLIKNVVYNPETLPLGPEWATLEELDFSENAREAWILAKPELRFLRHAVMDVDGALELLTEVRTPIPLPSLAVQERYGDIDLDRVAEIVAAKTFENLRTLEIDVGSVSGLPEKLVSAIASSGLTSLRIRAAAPKKFRAPRIAGKRFEVLRSLS